MAQYLEIYPENPQQRLLKQAAVFLGKGLVLAVPTDSSYALVCHLDDKNAADTLRRIRGVDEKHNFTLLCGDLKKLAQLANVDNQQFRVLKGATPGPFTFVLEATREVPRRVSHPSRKTIGIRIPEHKTLQMLLEIHGGPLLSTTLIPAGEVMALNDAEEIRSRYENQVAAIINAGPCHLEPTTVVDLTSFPPKVLRHGRGNIELLGL
jgi:tRNA threonylcarbamoyl adenosine modification protein (Sua5/YciO/YrdC/YwlC family)